MVGSNVTALCPGSRAGRCLPCCGHSVLAGAVHRVQQKAQSAPPTIMAVLTSLCGQLLDKKQGACHCVMAAVRQHTNTLLA